jgi:hypothetical protein
MASVFFWDATSTKDLGGRGRGIMPQIHHISRNKRVEIAIDYRFLHITST